jgi:hypothetical protein
MARSTSPVATIEQGNDLHISDNLLTVGEFVWAVKPDLPIKSLKDFKGRKIDYTNPRSTSQGQNIPSAIKAFREILPPPRDRKDLGILPARPFSPPFLWSMIPRCQWRHQCAEDALDAGRVAFERDRSTYFSAPHRPRSTQELGAGA